MYFCNLQIEDVKFLSINKEDKFCTEDTEKDLKLHDEKLIFLTYFYLRYQDI